MDIIKNLILIIFLFASCSESIKYVSKEYKIEEIYNDTTYFVTNIDNKSKLISEIGYIQSIDSILTNQTNLTVKDTFRLNLGQRRADLFVNSRIPVDINNENFNIFTYYVDFSPSNSELGFIGFFTIKFGTLYFRLTESSRIITLYNINKKGNKKLYENILIKKLSEKADSLRQNPPVIY